MTTSDVDDLRPRTAEEIERLNEYNAPIFDGTIGLRYTSIDLEGTRAEFSVKPTLLQPMGLVHGGVYCSVVESMASVAAANWFRHQEYGKGGFCVGVNNNTDFFHSAREGVLTAAAKPLHRGRLQQLWVVEITDESGKLMAKGQVRIQNLPPRPKTS